MTMLCCQCVRDKLCVKELHVTMSCWQCVCVCDKLRVDAEGRTEVRSLTHSLTHSFLHSLTKTLTNEVHIFATSDGAFVTQSIRQLATIVSLEALGDVKVLVLLLLAIARSIARGNLSQWRLA